MAKAEADRSRIKTEMRLADAGQQSERSRTAALEEEHGQIRQEIDALNRTMASLQRRLSALAVVPVRRRSSGQKVQIDQLKSEIARTQQRMNEKKERYRYLSVRL
jgi:chromosome segregation ATPase